MLSALPSAAIPRAYGHASLEKFEAETPPSFLTWPAPNAFGVTRRSAEFLAVSDSSLLLRCRSRRDPDSARSLDRFERSLPLECRCRTRVIRTFAEYLSHFGVSDVRKLMSEMALQTLIASRHEKRFQNVTCQPFVCNRLVRHSRINDGRTELILGSEKRCAQQRRYKCGSIIGSVGQKFENSGAHSRVA